MEVAHSWIRVNFVLDHFKCDFGHLSDFAELTTGAALSGSVKYPQRLSGTLGAHTEEINDE
ncbi:hypothetical protein FA041_16920 [Escherichia coli]|nr:hypothetical protein [Escherichia coli]MBW9312999.1 hypothetical protein [Escherichia coli]